MRYPLGTGANTGVTDVQGVVSAASLESRHLAADVAESTLEVASRSSRSELDAVRGACVPQARNQFNDHGRLKQAQRSWSRGAAVEAAIRPRASHGRRPPSPPTRLALRGIGSVRRRRTVMPDQVCRLAGEPSKRKRLRLVQRAKAGQLGISPGFGPQAGTELQVRGSTFSHASARRRPVTTRPGGRLAEGLVCG